MGLNGVSKKICFISISLALLTDVDKTIMLQEASSLNCGNTQQIRARLKRINAKLSNDLRG